MIRTAQGQVVTLGRRLSDYMLTLERVEVLPPEVIERINQTSKLMAQTEGYLAAQIETLGRFQ